MSLNKYSNKKSITILNYYASFSSHFLIGNFFHYSFLCSDKNVWIIFYCINIYYFRLIRISLHLLFYLLSFIYSFSYLNKHSETSEAEGVSRSISRAYALFYEASSMFLHCLIFALSFRMFCTLQVNRKTKYLRLKFMGICKINFGCLLITILWFLFFIFPK